jgi:hypothetical protein
MVALEMFMSFKLTKQPTDADPKQSQVEVDSQQKKQAFL